MARYSSEHGGPLWSALEDYTGESDFVIASIKYIGDSDHWIIRIESEDMKNWGVAEGHDLDISYITARYPMHYSGPPRMAKAAKKVVTPDLIDWLFEGRDG